MKTPILFVVRMSQFGKVIGRGGQKGDIKVRPIDDGRSISRKYPVILVGTADDYFINGTKVEFIYTTKTERRKGYDFGVLV